MKLRYYIFTFLLISTQAFSQEQMPLEQVIALALEKNYDVQLSKNLATASSIDNQYIVGAFLPFVNANATRLFNKNDQKQIAANNTVLEKSGVASNNLNANVQLTWTLFDGTKMFATRHRIDEIAAQGEFNVKNQIVNSIASVVNSYYNIVRQKQQLIAIQEQMSVSEERVKLAERKLQVGTGSKPELLQAKVDLNAQRTQVLQQETIIAQLKDQLNGLTGMQLPSVYEVTDSIVINMNLKTEDIESNIVNTNFGLVAIQKSISIANFALHERRAERLPVINFVSSYNFIRNENTVSFNPGQPLYSRNNGFNYGLTFSLPILNGFNNRRLVSQAKLFVDRQEILYAQLKSQIDVSIRNAFVNYDNNKKILLIEEDNILLAKENVFIAMEVFKRGGFTFIELRTAQQSLADAYNRLINARYNTKLAETELLRLNGGLLK